MESLQIIQGIQVLLREFGRPWFIAGGWAIDLHLNHVTRPHEDVEIAILRQDQLVLQEFLGNWDFQKVIPPAKRGLRESWETGEWLEKPVHEIHATRSEGDVRSLEILLNEVKGDIWVFRRDHRISLPLSKMGRVSAFGVPYLSPEIVLLYKTKYRKKKDDLDLENVVSHLDDAGRQWLRSAIEIHSPSHPWLDRL
ncbi:MAG: nucleotidyltransferase domain-containing protein [Candidatus Thorarchaeota archaeon]